MDAAGATRQIQAVCIWTVLQGNRGRESLMGIGSREMYDSA
jgi:hypothetical protein